MEVQPLRLEWREFEGRSCHESGTGPEETAFAVPLVDPLGPHVPIASRAPERLPGRRPTEGSPTLRRADSKRSVARPDSERAMNNAHAAATQTILRFLEASNRKDIEGMKRCLSKQSLESGSFHGESPELARYQIGEPLEEEGVLLVPASLVAKNPPPGQPASMLMPFVVVPEAGEWKIDLPKTMDRMFGGSLEKLAEQMAGAMRTAMEGVSTALAEGLGKALNSNELKPAQKKPATSKSQRPTSTTNKRRQ